MEAILQYQIIRNENLEKEMLITISTDELEHGIAEQIDKVKRDINIPGFRKGKVPKSIIRSRFGPKLKAQTLSDAVNEAFHMILAENNWRPASQAEMFDVKQETDLQFHLKFEVMPNIDLADYHDLEVFREENLPDDYLMEQAIKQLKEDHSSVNEVNRPAVVDDFITMELAILENNEIKKNESDIQVKIGDRNLPDELNRALVGVTKNSHKEVTIETSRYRFRVKKTEERSLPVIDDEFARNLKFDNLETLKKELLKQTKKAEEKRIEDEVKESLSNILIERNRFLLPKNLVDKEYKRILERLEQPDSESNRERFQLTAEKRVRLDLILSRIAEL
ncbi:trigger factor, partial [candidate division WOR-3 bacterium RBG_13_43_14]